jgi:hypothetical protein
MTAENSPNPTFKQKAAHELSELAIITGYLAFFFCSLAAYTSLLLDEYHIPYFAYGAACLNALLVAKVILIGEYAHLGARHENKPLVYSVIYKAFVYGLLVFAFHVVEEIIKRLIHGNGLAGAFSDFRMDEMLIRSLIIFGAFLPLFAFRELARVIGQDKFRALFFHRRMEADAETSRKA